MRRRRHRDRHKGADRFREGTHEVVLRSRPTPSRRRWEDRLFTVAFVGLFVFVYLAVTAVAAAFLGDGALLGTTAGSLVIVVLLMSLFRRNRGSLRRRPLYRPLPEWTSDGRRISDLERSMTLAFLLFIVVAIAIAAGVGLRLATSFQWYLTGEWNFVLWAAGLALSMLGSAVVRVWVVERWVGNLPWYEDES